MEALRAAGVGHVGMVVGGIVPEDEKPALLASGVGAILGPGTSREAIIDHVAALAVRVREIKDVALGEIA
jgi:methylmalonyl-CoA mutase C-terminal domain/subunit